MPTGRRGRLRSIGFGSSRSPTLRPPRRRPRTLCVPPGVGELERDQETDRALSLAVRISGELGSGLVQPGPFVACVQLDEGLDRDVPDRPELPEPTVRLRRLVGRRGTGLAGLLEPIRRPPERRPPRADLVPQPYFLNCAVRPGVNCPGLFANWSHHRIGSTWHGDYHTNYNLQQPFWVTFSANHVDKHLPYADLVEFCCPSAGPGLATITGCRARSFPHSAYPAEMRLMPYPVPTWGAQVSETPWVVQSLWWHYLYTMDRDFLRDRAFGPMREAVQFLNAYIRRAGTRGHDWPDDDYHIYPTVVPELHGLRVDPRFSADCNVDLTLTKFVFVRT
jgi:hypothetical protein